MVARVSPAVHVQESLLLRTDTWLSQLITQVSILGTGKLAASNLRFCSLTAQYCDHNTPSLLPPAQHVGLIVYIFISFKQKVLKSQLLVHGRSSLNICLENLRNYLISSSFIYAYVTNTIYVLVT